jgi:DNA-binding transcriptional ArsR family regulator
MREMGPFEALAEPKRRRMVEMLAAGPLSAGEIAAAFDISPPAVSQHLQVLLRARLLKVRPQAQRRVYEIESAGFEELDAWIARYRAFWTRRLDALDAALAQHSAAGGAGPAGESGR